jgi:hypothetical protein
VHNLTQLRKNSRKRPNKKAGKKQPRPCDEDQLSVINPAPDYLLFLVLSQWFNIRRSFTFF